MLESSCGLLRQSHSLPPCNRSAPDVLRRSRIATTGAGSVRRSPGRLLEAGRSAQAYACLLSSRSWTCAVRRSRSGLATDPALASAANARRVQTAAPPGEPRSAAAAGVRGSPLDRHRDPGRRSTTWWRACPTARLLLARQLPTRSTSTCGAARLSTRSFGWIALPPASAEELLQALLGAASRWSRSAKLLDRADRGQSALPGRDRTDIGRVPACWPASGAPTIWLTTPLRSIEVPTTVQAVPGARASTGCRSTTSDCSRPARRHRQGRARSALLDGHCRFARTTSFAAGSRDLQAAEFLLRGTPLSAISSSPSSTPLRTQVVYAKPAARDVAVPLHARLVETIERPVRETGSPIMPSGSVYHAFARGSMGTERRSICGRPARGRCCAVSDTDPRWCRLTSRR